MQAIRIDRGSSRPLTIQIMVAIRKLIQSNGLRAGERLPATRTLAKDLGVSRNTIMEVFDSLIAEGLVVSRMGAGTYVAEFQSPEAPPDTVMSDVPTRGNDGNRIETRTGRKVFPFDVSKFTPRLDHSVRAFTTALPALDLFPVSQWSRLSAKHWRENRGIGLGYGNLTGYLPLRESIASFLRANLGIDCHEKQIFMVNGAQQAFQVIGTFMLNPGDVVWFENPGALGARNALLAARARLQAVPVDSHGMDVAEGLRRAPDFRLAFVTPTHQQPLGVKMSLKRRVELLRAAEAADAFIIEDDYDSEFHYGPHRLPSLKSLDRNDRVLYVGTFSKTIFPALRLGYIMVPENLVDMFTDIFRSALPNVPTHSQAVLSSFMDEGFFGAHLRRMRSIYAERHQVLLDNAETYLDGLVDVRPVEAGLHTVGYLPAELDANLVARRAAERSVSVVPVDKFCMESMDLNGLLMGFSGIDTAGLKAGVKILRDVCLELFDETSE